MRDSELQKIKTQCLTLYVNENPTWYGMKYAMMVWE